jgi:hypothetical protein
LRQSGDGCRPVGNLAGQQKSADFGSRYYRKPYKENINRVKLLQNYAQFELDLFADVTNKIDSSIRP